jgi:hypothetical protein
VANNRVEFRKAPALTEGPAVFIALSRAS